MQEGELVNWRYTRFMKDNVHLRNCHTHLSQLIGHLENRARDMQRVTRVRRPEGESGG